MEPYAEEVWDLPNLMPGAAFPEFILGFIESRNVRLVHIMNARLAFDLLPDMTCLPQPPAIVVQLHGEEPNKWGYVRHVARRYANLVDAFSVVSEHLKQTVIGYEIPPSRVEAIYLGVDGEGEFNPDRVTPIEHENSAEGTKRILWPGRLVRDKDPMLTLEVVARARELGAQFVLDIVGDGHLKEPVRARAEELGVSDAIRWYPPSQEMARWYRGADLVLMTSLFEGVPLVIYEALAMGVPVIAPALPGNVELMGSQCGVLVEPRDDVERYAEAIVSLLADDERRRQIGEHSRERMLAGFSLTEMGHRHDRLYEQLLAKRTSSSLWRDEELLGEADSPRTSPSSTPSLPQLRREPTPDRTVGVIVPCYRHGIFLDACIASIKAQTHPPATIVVVDDCSDDPETLEALARLDRDPDVTVLRQPENRGPSAARNRALTEIKTSYFLPVDADDELLPDALERMLARLETAPPEVGFVYPSWRHIGNHSDEVQVPAYNLWLLMQQNYCGTPALFDRRLFDGDGVSYPEEIVVGHEDWDLVLQLAERGVRGVPADGPTFLYRKQGFSRVSAVDYGPVEFQKTVERRHPNLYGCRDEIKAKWAPALSIVLLDEDGATWAGGDLLPLERQTCGDFEVLARGDLGAGVRPVEVGDDAPLAWLQAAVYQARGRWILLLPRSAAAALASRSFVEQLIHAFIANERTVATVLAEAPDISRVAFSQLDNAERIRARPAAVAFERPLWGRAPDVPLGTEGTLLADLVVGLRTLGPVQWRLVSAEQGVAPWSASPTTRGTRIDLNLDRSAPAAEIAMRHMVSHQAPRLPELTPGTIRRWRHLDSWVPAQTSLLCRHRDPKTGVRMVNLDREPPPGYVLDQVLGCTRIFPAPGSARLIHADHSFSLGREGALAEGEYDLGYVENQPLPMLVGLELRRVPGPEGKGGQEILVAGPDDPLVYQSEHLATLGWIEPHPILPRPSEILHTGPWAVDSLRRRVDEDGWKHDYHAEAPDGAGDGITLGFLRRHPSGADLVALRRHSDGRLASELCIPGRASRDPQKLGRWLAEPVVFGNSAAARRAGAGSRLRHLALRAGNRRLADDEGEVMGYLQRQNGPGSSTLYSTIHPVTGDQIVTRFPERAGEQGYVLDGILGSIFDPSEDEEIERITPLPWGRLPRPG